MTNTPEQIPLSQISVNTTVLAPKSNKRNTRPAGAIFTETCTVKITKEQSRRLKVLEAHPHYVNIPNYIRDCIDRLYNARTIPKK